MSREGPEPFESARLDPLVSLRAECRDEMDFLMLESIVHDVRYAARSPVRQPGVIALAAGILALGLGINTAVLGVAYGVSGARCRISTSTG